MGRLLFICNILGVHWDHFKTPGVRFAKKVENHWSNWASNVQSLWQQLTFEIIIIESLIWKQICFFFGQLSILFLLRSTNAFTLWCLNSSSKDAVFCRKCLTIRFFFSKKITKFFNNKFETGQKGKQCLSFKRENEQEIYVFNECPKQSKHICSNYP